jgi:phosphoribosyl-ATP pyrophosphohydrolase
MADLLYHALVLLEATNLDVDRVWDELLERRR